MFILGIMEQLEEQQFVACKNPRNGKAQTTNFKLKVCVKYKVGFSGGSDGKESACDAKDSGSVPGLGRSPVEGNGNSLQYSCLEKSMDGGAWWATVHGVRKSQT